MKIWTDEKMSYLVETLIKSLRCMIIFHEFSSNCLHSPFNDINVKELDRQHWK